MIVVTDTPGCSDTYVHYRMTSAYYENNYETIVDSSGNSNNAVNGESLSNDNSDCTAYADGLLFSGSCYALFSGVSPSSNGFSIDTYLKVQSTSSSTEMTLVEALSGSTFKITLRPSNS